MHHILTDIISSEKSKSQIYKFEKNKDYLLILI